jgi:hypothetical protein
MRCGCGNISQEYNTEVLYPYLYQGLVYHVGTSFLLMWIVE